MGMRIPTLPAPSLRGLSFADPRQMTGGVSPKRQDTPSVFCFAKSTSLTEGGEKDRSHRKGEHCSSAPCHCEERLRDVAIRFFSLVARVHYRDADSHASV